MLPPVNRCRSPISTASANPVSGDTPAQATQPTHDGSELAAEGRLVER